MAKFKHELPSHEDCPVCGSELIVHTNAEQVCPCITEGGEEECDCNYTYIAGDGDPALCDECGFAAWVSADEDGAYVTYDEGSKANLEVWGNYTEKTLYEREKRLRNVIAECEDMDEQSGHYTLKVRSAIHLWSDRILRAAKGKK